MGSRSAYRLVEQPQQQSLEPCSNSRISIDSFDSTISSSSSVSTTSLLFDRIHESAMTVPQNYEKAADAGYPSSNGTRPQNNSLNSNSNSNSNNAHRLEEGQADVILVPLHQHRPMGSGLRNFLVAIAAFASIGWIVTLVVHFSNPYSFNTPHRPTYPDGHNNGVVVSPNSTQPGSGGSNPVTLEQVLGGFWSAKRSAISWIAGPDGEDGLLLEEGAVGKDYLVVEDVRQGGKQKRAPIPPKSRTLMKSEMFSYQNKAMKAARVWPSSDFKKVLIATNTQKNWRHSFYANYWILDVATQEVEPLDPENIEDRVQLATWSPTSDAVVFTRDNNMYLRRLTNKKVEPITKDGGENFFYGIPDWVYEEEVLSSNTATWWSADGKYIAFLATNEKPVQQFGIPYYFSRPSGKKPLPGLETYPDVVNIKYPKPGSPNPFVELKLYDVAKGDVFSVNVSGDFPPEEKLITEVVWAGQKLLVKESNRVSDIVKVMLIDVPSRAGKTVRELNTKDLGGGWFEVTSTTTYIPADPAKGRREDGYIDSVIHDDNIHLAYFTPLDSAQPKMLTSGNWEVVDGPSAVDLKNNLVYFVSTKESSIQRHVYSVQLDGTNLKPLTNTSAEGYYGASFSSGAGYALISYQGPNIPYQKVISTPGNPMAYDRTLQDNAALLNKTQTHALPELRYGQIEVEGVKLNFVERRPPGFSESKRYPVLFQQYSGPGSQQVSKVWRVDFNSYVASSLGYLVVTVDGRGTGFMGRRHRNVVRGRLGQYESHDQAAAGQVWARLPYVDPQRLAIWGWSFGGFNTLKTLETDAGRTFRYGMAVAPVTDWRYYDSVYTERYMLTPQQNPGGYNATAITNTTALANNVRFLVMHGVADDNVHFQNTLALLDKLDLAGIINYDVHVFPDSDHGISFHGANKVVFGKLSNWLINAFNGEWLKVANARPLDPRSSTVKTVKEKLADAYAECGVDCQ